MLLKPSCCVQPPPHDPPTWNRPCRLSALDLSLGPPMAGCRNLRVASIRASRASSTCGLGRRQPSSARRGVSTGLGGGDRLCGAWLGRSRGMQPAAVAWGGVWGALAVGALAWGGVWGALEWGVGCGVGWGVGRAREVAGAWGVGATLTPQGPTVLCLMLVGRCVMLS